VSGFKAPRKTLKLVFEDPELEGLVIRCYSKSLGSMLDLSPLMEVGESDFDSEKHMPMLELMFRQFIDSVIEWNIQDPEDGSPVPTTMEGLKSLDEDFALTISAAWMNAATGVSPDLKAPSSSVRSMAMEESLPMEPLSENRAS
jgi:hypothetical protein